MFNLYFYKNVSFFYNSCHILYKIIVSETQGYVKIKMINFHVNSYTKVTVTISIS